MTDMLDNYLLSEEDFYNYKFNELTSMEYYNKSIFNLMRKLPLYVKFVNFCETTEERRNKLDEVYGYIWQVTNYVIKNSKNEIITDDVVVNGELKSFHHIWKPSQDLEMMFYFNKIKNYGHEERILINYIKTSILKRQNESRLVKKLNGNK